jgi:hypothetical protein
MSARIPRRAVIAGALALPVAEPKAQTPRPGPLPGGAPARPLLIPNKTTLYQRIITHPGATLAPRPDGQGAQPIAGFEVFYVYARQGGDSGWVQVGRGSDGRTDGWVPAAKTIAWQHTLVGAFTNPAGRQPVLFLDAKDAEQNLLLDGHAGDTARQLLDAARGGNAGHVIAREPDAWANIDEHFYLLPILSSAPIEREFGPPLRLLEVISAPAQPSAPPPQDFKAAVVFLVDTTISMQPYINGTREVIRQVVERIRSTPMGNLFRFGLVAYRDSLEDTAALEYYAKVYARPDFSQPAEAILAAIDQVKEAKASSLGYDEDPIGGLKSTMDEIYWSSISPGYRHVILITDAAARPGNHPHSVTRMSIPEIKQYTTGKGVQIWALHLLTQEGSRHDDWPLAARQYKELTALNETTQLYYPVPAGQSGAQYATQADFENQADHLARAVITAAAQTSGRPVPDFGPTRGQAPPQLAQQLPVIREAMRLAYIGHVQQTTAPEAIRSWTTDRDLADPALTSLGVRVLLTKNQLSDLAATLKQVLRLGRSGQLEPGNFFAQLQSAVASSFRDPQQIPQATRIGSLLGEFLEDLPYKSELLETSSHEWEQMTAIKRDAIMNGIDDRLSLYAAFDGEPDKWYDLGNSHSPSEAVYPVPIEALP